MRKNEQLIRTDYEERKTKCSNIIRRIRYFSILHKHDYKGERNISLKLMKKIKEKYNLSWNKIMEEA